MTLTTNTEMKIEKGSSTAFIEDLRFSHQFDDFIAMFLSSYFHGDIEMVFDLTRQKTGIDFIIKKKPEVNLENDVNVDLKTYRKDDGNLYLEVYTNRLTGKYGWLLTPENKTDLYVFYMPTTHRIILASKDLLLEIVKIIESMTPDKIKSFLGFNTNSLGSYYKVPISTFSYLSNRFLFVDIDLKQLYGGAD